MRRGAPGDLVAGGNGNREIGDQHRGQRQNAAARDGREVNPQAAKLSNWMVRAEKGGESRRWRGRAGERDFSTSHSEVSDSLPTTHTCSNLVVHSRSKQAVTLQPLFHIRPQTSLLAQKRV